MARHRLTLLILVLTLSVTLSNSLAAKSPVKVSPKCFTMAVPAYAYPNTPNDFWSNSAPVKAGTIYIMNPANGPGIKVDPLYTSMANKVKQSGIRVFGYVDTDYGRRSEKSIIVDVDKFKKMYPITGVFLDQTQLDASHLAYYTAISNQIRARKLPLAFNPGQPIIDERYMALASHIMTFEGPLTTYQKTSFPQWQSKYPSQNFWHLVYDVPSSATMRQVITRANTLPVGLLYITNRHMPNPWDAIPPYWTEEIKSLCPIQTAIPR
jgi:hypothetical protein